MYEFKTKKCTHSQLKFLHVMTIMLSSAFLSALAHWSALLWFTPGSISKMHIFAHKG